VKLRDWCGLELLPELKLHTIRKLSDVLILFVLNTTSGRFLIKLGWQFLFVDYYYKIALLLGLLFLFTENSYAV